MDEEDRIARLAKRIDTEVRKRHHEHLTEVEVITLGRQGAIALHSICSDFVVSVNRQLSPAVLDLSPPEYAAAMFRESGANLIQVNARGRIIQIVFERTAAIFFTEKFRIPYILEGEVRAYNQEMLERTRVRNLALFYCLEEPKNIWHYFDWLSGRTGAFGRDQLVSLLERLV